MNNNMHPASVSTHVVSRHALPRHLSGIAIAAVGFITVCNYGHGWFMPIVSYTLLMAAIIGTANYHLPAEQRASRAAITIINLVGCSLLVGALWFSGRMTQMF